MDHVLCTLSPEQFDEWVAFRQVVPDPLERIAKILVFGFCVLARSWGADIEPEHLDPLAPEGEYDQAATVAQVKAATKG